MCCTCCCAVLSSPVAGAGVLFGNSGGVMEAAVRTVYEVVTGKVNCEALYIKIKKTCVGFRGGALGF